MHTYIKRIQNNSKSNKNKNKKKNKNNNSTINKKHVQDKEEIRIQEPQEPQEPQSEEQNNNIVIKQENIG